MIFIHFLKRNLYNILTNILDVSSITNCCHHLRFKLQIHCASFFSTVSDHWKKLAFTQIKSNFRKTFLKQTDENDSSKHNNARKLYSNHLLAMVQPVFQAPSHCTQVHFSRNTKHIIACSKELCSLQDLCRIQPEEKQHFEKTELSSKISLGLLPHKNGKRGTWSCMEDNRNYRCSAFVFQQS